MDISEVRKKQIDLAETISEAITDFEKASGVVVSRIELERIQVSMVSRKEEDNYLLNVDVRIEL